MLVSSLVPISSVVTMQHIQSSNAHLISSMFLGLTCEQCVLRAGNTGRDHNISEAVRVGGWKSEVHHCNNRDLDFEAFSRDVVRSFAFFIFDILISIYSFFGAVFAKNSLVKFSVEKKSDRTHKEVRIAITVLKFEKEETGSRTKT